MSILDEPLFSTGSARTIGAGLHNVGSGVLRASDEAMVKKVELHYGERCGHLPLDAGLISVLVNGHSEEIRSQMEYLSELFGKKITALTFDEFKEAHKGAPAGIPLVVPYINVPETEVYIREYLEAETWGIPGKMTHILKNKADFYQLLDEFATDSFCSPDYTIVKIYDLAREAYTFLSMIEDVYKKAGLGSYPLGVMLRAAESDGNYGCCVVYERENEVILVHDGDAERARHFLDWREALAVAQELLAGAMDVRKEERVVISRYIELFDSPGMSAVIMNGQIESLRWNDQLQMPGSKACVGTGTFVPKSPYLQQMQEQYEDHSVAFFETLLHKTAEKCDIDFASVRGVANLDLLIPGDLEEELQRQRQGRPAPYIAECNPRWTNYTDAIMTILGASRKAQTASNMRAVIQEGICTFDKYPLPQNVDPRNVRECIFERDNVLKLDGTRIVCRMAKNPLGLIFAGSLKQAQQEMEAIIATLATKTVRAV